MSNNLNEKERMAAKELREGLQIIEEMSRTGLLIALGWDSSKDNTVQLRRRARRAFILGSPSFDLWAGYGEGL